MPHSIDDINRRQRHRLAVNALWLLRLRWVAAVGQVVTVGVAHWGFGIHLPIAPLFAIIGLTVVTNAMLALVWSQQIRDEQGPLVESQGERWLAWVMAVDLISLATLLSLTGGLENPFTVFYFVNLSLSAVLLSPRSSWQLTAIAIGSMFGVFALHRPIPGWSDPASDASLLLRQFSLLVACSCCAGVVVYFINRVVNELHRRESELRKAEQERASAERLEALATLAAGAGHELASPLSTIAVIASDLKRHLEGADVPDTVRNDVALIRQELDHCRSILHRMSSQAGHELAEEIADVDVGEIVEQVMSGVRRRNLVDITMADEVSELPIHAPLEGLAQAIRGVVQNAIDASPPDESVRWSIASSNGLVQMIVRDQGEGMDAATLARAGEPFFTTKETGNGMGLGLFLTRNVIERLGGELQLDSQPTIGTTVEIRLPIAKA